MWPECWGIPYRCEVPEYVPGDPAMEPTLLAWVAIGAICVLMGLRSR